MLLNITINLGNIWDALSAIGTVGAVIISLWITLPTKFVFGKVSLKGIKEPCTELPHNVMPHECASIAYDLKLLQEIIKNDNFDNEGTYQFLIGTTFGKKFKTKKISGRELLKIVKE